MSRGNRGRDVVRERPSVRLYDTFRSKPPSPLQSRSTQSNPTLASRRPQIQSSLRGVIGLERRATTGLADRKRRVTRRQNDKQLTQSTALARLIRPPQTNCVTKHAFWQCSCAVNLVYRNSDITCQPQTRPTIRPLYSVNLSYSQALKKSSYNSSFRGFVFYFVVLLREIFY